MTDPTDLAGIDADEQELAQAATAKRTQEQADLKWLMSHAPGRRIVARVLEQTAPFRTAFHTNGSTMAFNEGRKTIGYWLTGELLEAAPDTYLRMLKEYAK